NQLHHFELARRQQIKQTTSFIPFRCAASLLGRSTQSILNALQELLRFEWFWKKIDRSCLHHSSAHGDVSVPGNKDKLLFAAALNESLLEIDSVYAGHLHIDNDAGWSRMRWAR